MGPTRPSRTPTVAGISTMYRTVSGVELSLMVSHPDYVSEPSPTAAKALGLTTAMLRVGTATLALKGGVIVRGRVTDPTGKAVKNAIVIHGNDAYGGWKPSSFVTDADGRYRLPALPPGTTSLTVIAPGWAPQMRKVNLTDSLPAQDFRLAAGKPVKLRFVDSAGKPVPNARVHLREWRNSKSIYSDHNPNYPKLPDSGIPAKADAAGLWVWPAAPDDPVKISVYADGFAERDLEVRGGSAELQVVLKAEHRFTGSVTDAVTGKPIPSFTIIPVDVFPGDSLIVERYHAAAGKEWPIRLPGHACRHPDANPNRGGRLPRHKTGRNSASASTPHSSRIFASSQARRSPVSSSI